VVHQILALVVKCLVVAFAVACLAAYLGGTCLAAASTFLVAASTFLVVACLVASAFIAYLAACLVDTLVAVLAFDREGTLVVDPASVVA